MWLILSFASAFSESIKDVFGKIGSNKTNEYTSALVMHLVTFIVTLPLIFFIPIPKLLVPFWLSTLAFMFITPLWSVLYMKSLKEAPLSLSLPMMAFNPVLTGLLAYVFGGKAPTMYGWVGILFIGIGIYLINIKNNKESGIFTPIIHIINNKGALYMLAVALLWSVGAHLSKIRVDSSSAFFSTWTASVTGIISTYFLALLRKQRISIKSVRTHFITLLPIGFFYYIATISSNVALISGSAVYVFSIKRSSLLFSALAGKLFFREKFNIFKYLGLGLLLVGILFIAK